MNPPNERYRPKKPIANNCGDYTFKIVFDRAEWLAIDSIGRRIDLSRSAVVRRIVQHAIRNPEILEQVK